MTSGNHATAGGGDERPVLLIFSQTFVPDPASVGQHVADVAVEMASRGHRVRVYTSARGFEDPSRKYPPRENLQGVDVRRLPLASFGKRSLFARGVGGVTFLLQCLLLGLFTRRVAGILFSTSPPMAGVAATLIRFVRRVPIAYWAMDLNPDQLIAMGKVKPTDFFAKVLEASNRLILKHAALVVALDRFMAKRLQSRGVMHGELLVSPPWPHEDRLETVPHECNPFRKRHHVDGKFVVMYSGNHSPSNPLRTVLEAALRLRDEPQFVFAFIGGGLGKREVEDFAAQHKLPNVLLLPYQPLADLRFSLSAADVHLVSLGDSMVGIIHPCKVYGAMAVGRPILYLGPRPSHIADLLDQHRFGLHAAHGDVDAAEAAIRRLYALPSSERAAMGEEAKRVLESSLSMEHLRGRFCDAVERALGLVARPAVPAGDLEVEVAPAPPYPSHSV